MSVLIGGQVKKMLLVTETISLKTNVFDNNYVFNTVGPCRTHDDCSYNSYCDKWGVDSNFTQCWHCRDCERRLKEGPHFPIDGQCPVRCPLSSETLGDRAGSAEQAHISGLVSYAVLTVLMARLLLWDLWALQRVQQRHLRQGTSTMFDSIIYVMSQSAIMLILRMYNKLYNVYHTWC